MQQTVLEPQDWPFGTQGTTHWLLTHERPSQQGLIELQNPFVSTQWHWPLIHAPLQHGLLSE